MKQGRFYYLTKYALTRGIERASASKVNTENDNGYLYVTAPKGYAVQYRPGEWFDNISEAQAKAEKMRAKRIASLRSSIEKLTDQHIAVVEFVG